MKGGALSTEGRQKKEKFAESHSRTSGLGKGGNNNNGGGVLKKSSGKLKQGACSWRTRKGSRKQHQRPTDVERCLRQNRHLQGTMLDTAK